MQRHKKVYIFYHINPLSFIWALFLSVFYRIYFWRIDQLAPERVFKRLQPLDPADHFELSEWQDLDLATYPLWSEACERWRADLPLILQDQEFGAVDYSEMFFQYLAINGRYGKCFLEIVQRWCAAHPEIRDVRVELPYFVRNRAYFRLDYGTIKFKQALSVQVMTQLYYYARNLLYILRCLRSRKTAEAYYLPQKDQIKFIFDGIAATELAEAADKLDFSFLIRRGVLNKEHAAYVLPSLRTRTDYREKLRERGIQFIEADALDSILSPQEHSLFLKKILRLFWRGCVSKRLELLFLYPEFVRMMRWLHIGAGFKNLQRYLAPVSAAWPENPAVTALNALNVKTTNWWYSSNDFMFSKRSGEFDDLSPRRCVPASREIWVWTEELSEALLVRELPFLRRPNRFKYEGAVMCGDSRWVELLPEAARQKFFGPTWQERGELCLSLFDVPPVTKLVRVRDGWGPSEYSIEIAEQLFADVRKLLEQFSGLKVFFKPKKPLRGNQLRDYPEQMWVLLNPEGAFVKERRVIVLDHDADPYIPVALAELSVGLPFTSPVIVAQAFQRIGYFYDPLHTALAFRPKSYEPIVLHGFSELQDMLTRILNDKMMFASEYGELEVIKRMRDQKCDPAKRYFELLSPLAT